MNGYVRLLFGAFGPAWCTAIPVDFGQGGLFNFDSGMCGTVAEGGIYGI
jgi:hypothetical protein